MWIQDQPLALIEIVDGECWDIFEGNYFRRIKVQDLLQYQRPMPHPENKASSTRAIDTTSFLLFFARGSTIAGNHKADDLE